MENLFSYGWYRRFCLYCFIFNLNYFRFY